jgi:hypothetical protein
MSNIDKKVKHSWNKMACLLHKHPTEIKNNINIMTAVRVHVEKK